MTTMTWNLGFAPKAGTFVEVRDDHESSYTETSYLFAAIDDYRATASYTGTEPVHCTARVLENGRELASRSFTCAPTAP